MICAPCQARGKSDVPAVRKVGDEPFCASCFGGESNSGRVRKEKALGNNTEAAYRVALAFMRSDLPSTVIPADEPELVRAKLFRIAGAMKIKISTRIPDLWTSVHVRKIERQGQRN